MKGFMNANFFEEQRREMVAAIRAIAEHIAAELGKTALDERVLRAMTKVPRHEFVPVEVQSYAYLNRPIPIGFDKTISQPLMVAVMTDLLELKPDDVVLEIGTGLGYQSAVLAELSGRVYSVEIIDELAHRAAETTGLHQRRSPHWQRLHRLAQSRPVRQSDGDRRAGPDPSSPDQPAQDRRKDGDPSWPAWRSAACRGRERLERQGHNEGNYAGTILGARGIRRICNPGILIKPIALERADIQLSSGNVRFLGVKRTLSQAAHARRSGKDCGQHRQAAGAG
jgi:protein-L-isoaspartate O-methyltransferase